jgi:hypothetical protein
MARTPNSRWLRIGWFGLALVAIVNFAIAAGDLSIGGFSITVFGLRLSSWEVYKPLTYGIVSALLAFWIRDSVAEPDAISWNVFHRRAGSIAAAIALTFVVIAIRWNGFAAGGPDGYGYVSEAIHWASGYSLVPDRIAELAPVIGPAAAPIAYVLAPTPGRIAPVYAPGLPLLMAPAYRLGGMTAIFFVVPLVGGAAVWLTYKLGARVADRRTACVAAVLLAFSPLFLFDALTPMSDIPATAWWLLALLLAAGTTVTSALLAGLAAAAAILTRPNVVPLAIVLALFIWRRSGFRAAIAFGAGVVPSCLAVAVLNQRYYGSPLHSGYGPFETLFQVNFASTNIRQFGAWLVELHTPAVLIAAVVGAFSSRLGMRGLMIAFVAVLFGCYVFYIPFDNWTFLRFLLPAIPLLVIFGSAAIVDVLDRLPPTLRSGVAFVVCAVGSCWFIATANRIGVFDVNRGEQRFVTVARAAEEETPPNAVIISLIHSGNVRLYGQRASIRWDLIDPDRLDATIDVLRTSGYDPYILLEDWEETRFRDRFATRSAIGRIDWPPRVEFVGHVQVRLYAPDDRALRFDGERPLPRMIPG